MKNPAAGKPDRSERPRARGKDAQVKDAQIKNARVKGVQVKDARANDPQESPAVTGEKLQKVLADRGYASRRAIEDWIRSGRVLVNGAAAHVGQRVIASDRVMVDGVPLREASRDTAGFWCSTRLPVLSAHGQTRRGAPRCSMPCHG